MRRLASGARRPRPRPALVRLVVTGVLGVVPVVLGALPPAVARADGDPASDVLLNQDVFLPYSGVSADVQRRLFALCAEARQAGYPVKIALIASTGDLGVVPALFNRPRAYARFLSAELGGVVRGPVLVVMPAGIGVATQGHALAAGTTAAPPVATRGPDALANAALAAVPRLAAATGHPLNGTPSSAGASATTVGHAVTAMIVLALLATGGISAALAVRRRRAARPHSP